MKIQNLIVNHEHNIHPLNPKLGGGGGGGGVGGGERFWKIAKQRGEKLKF